MGTVIKAWKADHPSQENCRLHAIVIVADGGDHYHLILQEERRYETLEEAGKSLGEALMESTVLYGIINWRDDTDSFDEDPHIVRGDN